MQMLSPGLLLRLCLLMAPWPLPGGAGITELHPDREGALKLLWYNVENLFHPDLDSMHGAEVLDADVEFSPLGPRSWTHARYRKKLSQVARVIVAAGHWEAPALVALCEVENARVLEDLIAHPILRSWDYSYLHRDSPDHRGMDLALLFRDALFSPTRWTWHRSPPHAGLGQTRLMLHVSGKYGRRAQGLDLLCCHLVSRYGGSAATAAYRMDQARLLHTLADSLVRQSPERLLVVAGDFNAEADAWSMEPLRAPLASGGCLLPLDFSIQAAPGRLAHAYKYRGVWSSIDRFLLGGGVEGHAFRATVLALPALLEEDEAHGGMKPFRSYLGYRYQGGYSDHLPILLEIGQVRDVTFPFR